MPFAHAGPPLLDFSRSEVAQTFRVINDEVMGGVSTSRLSSTDGAMVFEGEVSLENNGGFASFRGPVRFPVESAALLLTVRGDSSSTTAPAQPNIRPPSLPRANGKLCVSNRLISRPVSAGVPLWHRS
jgi:hypothetical protein